MLEAKINEDFHVDGHTITLMIGDQKLKIFRYRSRIIYKLYDEVRSNFAWYQVDSGMMKC